jgi:hypothetical protein
MDDKKSRPLENQGILRAGFAPAAPQHHQGTGQSSNIISGSQVLALK